MSESALIRKVATASNDQIRELQSALSAALEWIDAVPKDVVSKLPGMPGFDRDWANSLVEERLR